MTAGSSKRLQVRERDARIVVSGQINPRDLSDQDLPILADEITAVLGTLAKGKPVVLEGDWPLWAIARAARLVHPTASWIGVHERSGDCIIAVAGGQHQNRFVSLGEVIEGQYGGTGPCTMEFGATGQSAIYCLIITHPTAGRPIDGHTTVDVQSIVEAINQLRPPSDLQGIVLTGYAWRVVVAMAANAPALRSARWFAVDEPRRGGAVISWAELEQAAGQRPGLVVPGAWSVETTPTIPVPPSTQPQVSPPAELSRIKDLEELIRRSYKIIHDYENTIQTTDRPEEEARARQAMERQWKLIREYLQEYRQLRPGAWSRDIREMALRCS